jgi:D-tyrosyl-tRNA(Tyr) deacylase
VKIVLQRVSRASVTVEERVKGRIGEGYMALVGITDTDTEEILKYMAEKMINLRIFEDEAGKMNRSLLDVGGEILLISQFTLYADCKKGRRPSFIKAGSPAFAEQMYENMIKYLEHLLPGKIQTGQFGADMKVELVNDGPVTIVLDSDEIM